MGDNAVQQSKSSAPSAKQEIVPQPISESESIPSLLLRASAATPPAKPRPRDVLWLQRKIGNHATRQFLAGQKSLPAHPLPAAFTLQRDLITDIDDAHIDGSETLTGDLFIEGGSDTRETPVAPHLSGIHPSDARQGYLGDCFAVASLAAIAQQNPQIIYDAIRDNHDGTYTVTLYNREYAATLGSVTISELLERNYTLVAHEYTVTSEVLLATTRGASRTVGTGRGAMVATDLRPESLHIRPDDSTTTTDATGTSSRRDELWAVVMERALGMYLSGSSDIRRQYQRLDEGGRTDGGSTALVLEALTGQRSEVSGMFDSFAADALDARFRRGEVIIVETTEMLMGEGGPHAYYVTSVDTERNAVLLRNPQNYDEVRIELPLNDPRIARIITNPARSPRAAASASAAP